MQQLALSPLRSPPRGAGEQDTARMITWQPRGGSPPRVPRTSSSGRHDCVVRSPEWAGASDQVVRRNQRLVSYAGQYTTPASAGTNRNFRYTLLNADGTDALVVASGSAANVCALIL